MAIFSVKTLSDAFESIQANRGCAGVDGITISRFEKQLDSNLTELADSISNGSYFPLPLLKIIVAKKDGEPRGLCIPTVRDRVAQKAALDIIEPALEKEFEDCSFAYRKNKSVRQAIHQIKNLYDDGYFWVVDADIDAFFDNVDHELLFKKLDVFIKDASVLNLLNMWITAEVWDGKAITILEKGIPQGSPISPILANLLLDELDEILMKEGYRHVRYADDFIILCKNSENAQSAMELTKKTLDKLLLKVDEADITNFDHGFKYLGVLFIKSMILKPFETPKRKRQILNYPPPMNVDEYLKSKNKSKTWQTYI